MTEGQDPRRLVAFVAFGTYRLLYDIHALLEDVCGAVDAQQRDLAVLQARAAAVSALSIRSLRLVGDPDDGVGQLSFDPFTGVPGDEVQRALALAHEGMTVVWGPAAKDWVRRLHDYVDETERLLGYRKPLAELRSPSGLFPSIRLARTLVKAVEECHLPNLFPSEWTSGG
jgi:hypothetical protein